MVGASGLLDKLGIPSRIIGEVVPPGTDLGTLHREIAPGRIRLIAPASHDTASAVAAVPFGHGSGSAFISSWAWSLVGLEVEQPLINEATLDSNLTNEGGVAGTFRLLKNCPPPHAFLQQPQPHRLYVGPTTSRRSRLPHPVSSKPLDEFTAKE